MLKRSTHVIWYPPPPPSLSLSLRSSIFEKAQTHAREHIHTHTHTHTRTHHTQIHLDMLKVCVKDNHVKSLCSDLGNVVSINVGKGHWHQTAGVNQLKFERAWLVDIRVQVNHTVLIKSLMCSPNLFISDNNPAKLNEHSSRQHVAAGQLRTLRERV